MQRSPSGNHVIQRELPSFSVQVAIGNAGQRMALTTNHHHRISALSRWKRTLDPADDRAEEYRCRGQSNCELPAIVRLQCPLLTLLMRAAPNAQAGCGSLRVS